jgi:hypothetical protein
MQRVTIDPLAGKLPPEGNVTVPHPDLLVWTEAHPRPTGTVRGPAEVARALAAAKKVEEF